VSRGPQIPEFRRLAAAMDLRIQQLTAEGVHGTAIIERMVGHLPDLQQIWVGTSDNQLAMIRAWSFSISFWSAGNRLCSPIQIIFTDRSNPGQKPMHARRASLRVRATEHGKPE